MGGQKSQMVDLKIAHPRLSQAKIVMSKDDRTLQIIQTVKEKDYDNWVEAIKLHPKASDTLMIPKTWSFSRLGFCGDAGTVTLNYPDFPYLLSDQIYNRAGMKSHFEETELWVLLYTLISAKLYLRETKKNVGDIRPENVLVNIEHKVKVICNLSWPEEKSGYEKAFQGQKAYVSPQQMISLERTEVNHLVSESSEIFSIGFTLLSSALLVDLNDIYNMKTHKFNSPIANDRLTQFRFTKNYSEVLRGIISNMCSLNPEGRMTLDEVWGLLKKHAPQIEAQQNFLIDNAPDRLHQEISLIRSIINEYSQRSSANESMKDTLR